MPLADNFISMAIEQYRHALRVLQDDVDAKNWEHLVVAQVSLEAATEKMKTAFDKQPITAEIIEDLEQLSLQHRRTMRQLHQHMNMVKENLDYVDNTLNKVDHMAEFVAEGFKFPS